MKKLVTFLGSVLIAATMKLNIALAIAALLIAPSVQADDRSDEIAIVQDYISRPAHQDWRKSKMLDCKTWQDETRALPIGTKLGGIVGKILIACDAESNNGVMDQTQSLAFFEILFEECSEINPNLANDIHGLNRAEKFSICLYSNFVYSELNSNLRKNEGKPLVLPNVIRILDSALLKLPDYTNSIVTRMVNLKPHDLSTYAAGKKIIWHAYTSSSFGENPFSGNVKFVIKSKSGKAIHEISGLPKETEVLFARSSEFIVTSVTAAQNGLTVIELEQM